MFEGKEALPENDSPEPPALPCYLIHDSSLQAEDRTQLSVLASVTFLPWSERNTPPQNARVLIYLDDEMIRELALQAMELEWEVGVLPHPQAKLAMTALGVKGSLDRVFVHYLKAPLITVDALMCNDELVFSSVVIGRVLALRPYDINRPQRPWDMLLGALKGLGHLRLSAYTLVTGKERVIELAALGMVVLGQTQSALVGYAFNHDLSGADNRLSLLALAPRSVVSYLWFLLRLLLPGKFKLSQLPHSLSLIQTDRLKIVASQGTEYLLDGKPAFTRELEFRVQKARLRLLPGPSMVPRKEVSKSGDKETVRLNQVPQQDAAGPLLERDLPVFTHASEEEYRDLFISLRDNAKSSTSFRALMVLSVLLALAGLYANSAPVIIGAMILAPLMSPIVSLAMGVARSDSSLIRTALRTLMVGIGLGLVCGIVMAWVMPLNLPTEEMKMRMSPTLLDLLVAVISGLACAYANSREEIAKSLAGVAIAVALVPPLGVVGTGLGWADWSMAGGAALLLLTNLVGITLAASAAFLVLGFAPFNRARAGLGITLLMLLVVAVPLSLSFAHLVERERLLESVPTGDIQLTTMKVHVDSANVSLDKPPLVNLVLSSAERVDANDVEELKTLVAKKLGEPIEIEVQSNIRR